MDVCMDLEEEEKTFSSSRSRRPDRKKKTQNLFSLYRCV